MAAGWITGCRFSGAAGNFNLHAHLFLVTSLISDWTGHVFYLANRYTMMSVGCWLNKAGLMRSCCCCAGQEVREMHLRVALLSFTRTHAHPPTLGPKPVSRNPSDLLRVDILLGRKRIGEMLGWPVSICAGLRAGIVLTIFGMWLKSWGSTPPYTTEGV